MIACQPSLCISTDFFVWIKCCCDFCLICQFLEISDYNTSVRHLISNFCFLRISSQIASKSNPKLPSLASILEYIFRPTLKSFSAFGQCQSSKAKFHLEICSGIVQQSQTFCGFAEIVVSTVIFFGFMFFIFLNQF